MHKFGRVWVRTAQALTWTAVWLLAVEAVDPSRPRVAMERVVTGILALVLAFGLLPGSYLDRLIRKGVPLAVKSSAPRIWAVAVAPTVLLILALLMVLGDIQILQAYGLIGLEDPIGWSLVRGIGVAAIASGTLMVNGLTLRRSD
ncbi:MAG: hypothetical protein AB1449_15295 [Chloroflexota bacterium]